MTSLRRLARRGDRERMGLERSEPWNTQVQMLTWFPGQMDVLDGDNRDVAPGCPELDFMANHFARTALARSAFPESNIPVHGQQ
jgi:hypothetical protein